VDAVARLETFADVDDEVAHARQISVSVRHEAVLVSGRRVLLLDDRGWSASVSSSSPDIWAATTVEDITDTARMVVGPDEPFEGGSPDDEATNHWGHLAEVLREHGMVADASELSRLPHDVVLSDRLVARIGHVSS
jgi:hypothetical protein